MRRPVFPMLPAAAGLRGHAEINRDLGDPDYPATAVVDRFLARIFG